MFIKKFNESLAVLWKKEGPLFFVWVGIAVYVISFSTVSFLRYAAFSYTDFDFAMYVHEAWKIAHGSFKSSIFNNVPIYGVYLEFISCLIAPIFILSNSDPRSLLFLQALLLGLGALPVYWIAREMHSSVVSALLAFAYLFYPALWYTNLYEFYPVVFSTFFFLWMFYCMEKDRFGAFLVLLLIALSIRVDMTITIFMYGVYALLTKRSWKWVITPCVISVVWLYVGLFLIIPKFQGHLNFAQITYSYLGGNFNEVLYNVIKNPQMWTSVVFSELSYKFLLELLIPLLFLPLGSIKEVLFCLPSLSQHLLSGRWQEHTIHFHYTATITPFLFISTIYALQRHFKREHAKVLMGAVIFLAVLASNFFFGPISKIESYRESVTVRDLDRYKESLVKKIPLNANTVSTFEFSSWLAGRENYYSMHYIYWGHFVDKVVYETPTDIQYALIDFNDPRMRSFRTPHSDINLRRFLDKDWRVIDSIESIMLLKKDSSEGAKPYEVELFSSQERNDPVLAHFSDFLELIQLSADFKKDDAFRTVEMRYQFYVLKALGRDLGVFVQLLDEHGKTVYFNYWDMCHGIYPARRWNSSEMITDRYTMLIPDNVPPGTYKLTFSLYDSRTTEIIPVRYSGASQEDRRTYFASQLTIR